MLAQLTLRLTRARLTAHEGETLLYLASILACVATTCAALTVAGGTWMFYNRSTHPERLSSWGTSAQAIGWDIGNAANQYVVLALLACVMLIPAMIGLAAGAAVLGAHSREKRLAVLRLVGLSGWDVTLMSLLDTLIQATAGAIVGTVIYTASLPAWSSLVMMGTRVRAEEMLLPPHVLAAVLAGVIVIALVSAWWGLHRVRISPLGVSRRTNAPRARAWRAVPLPLILVTAPFILSRIPTEQRALAVGALIVIVVAAFDAAGSWGVQLLARALASRRGPVTRWAARRIQAGPVATWHRVSAMGSLAFIGGFMSLMPLQSTDQPISSDMSAQNFIASMMWDFKKGAVITLAFGFLITATSLLITQASGTIERAEQSRALRRLGAPAGYSLRVMWVEAYGPLLLAVTGGAGLGALMGTPFLQASVVAGFSPVSGLVMMVAVVLIGLILTAIALRACHGLYYRLLGVEERTND